MVFSKVEKAYFFEDYKIGEEFVTKEFSITKEDIEKFAQLTYDINPLHLDEEYAKQAGYEGIISHGLLSVSICSGLAYQSGLFDRKVLGLVSQTIKYKKPVYVGKKLRFCLKVINKREVSSKSGLVNFETKLIDENGETLIAGEWTLLILRKNT
jgi:acyl dehydratase